MKGPRDFPGAKAKANEVREASARCSSPELARLRESSNHGEPHSSPLARIQVLTYHVALTASGGLPPEHGQRQDDERGRNLSVTLNINGKDVSVNADPGDTLQLVLRDDLGMTGTKFGCGVGQCGACSVILDGKAVRSCQTKISDAVGHKVMTIEGLAQGDKLHTVQQAWVDMQVPQCGYCQSGQIMEAVAFLAVNPKPTEAQVRDAMSGHLCRCGTYDHITAAILKAAGTAA